MSRPEKRPSVRIPKTANTWVVFPVSLTTPPKLSLKGRHTQIGQTQSDLGSRGSLAPYLMQLLIPGSLAPQMSLASQ